MEALLRQARFLKGATSAHHFPEDSGVEVAFCGRSNAGKSSAINALCQQHRLAYTSKTPGRTQAINFFKLSGDFRLVDLPGYGYAKATTTVWEQWQRLTESYVARRRALCGLMLLMDVRHPLMEIDWTMLRWGQHYQLPMHVLLTKVDKVNRSTMARTLTKVASSLEQEGLHAGVQLFSTTKRVGISQAREKICAWLRDTLITARAITPTKDTPAEEGSRGQE